MFEAKTFWNVYQQAVYKIISQKEKQSNYRIASRQANSVNPYNLSFTDIKYDDSLLARIYWCFYYYEQCL